MRREGVGNFWSDRESLRCREGFILPRRTQKTQRRGKSDNTAQIGRTFPANLIDHDLSRRSYNSVGGPSCLNFFAPLLRFRPLGGLACSCVASGLGCETEFAEILLGERGLGIADGFEVLGFDLLVDFASVDRNGFGSIDPDAHVVAIDTLYDQNDVIANLDCFVDFSGKCKHRSGLSLDAYAVSSIRTWVVE